MPGGQASERLHRSPRQMQSCPRTGKSSLTVARAPDLGKSACLLEDGATQAEVTRDPEQGHHKATRDHGVGSGFSGTAMLMPRRGRSGSQRPPRGSRKGQQAEERQATGDPGRSELPGAPGASRLTRAEAAEMTALSPFSSLSLFCLVTFRADFFTKCV